ncbi:MAG: glycosyltransferase family 4 protein [Acidimicrobiales bacterium]
MTTSPGGSVGALARPLPVGVDVAAIPVDALGAGQYALELVRALSASTDVALTLVTRRDDGARWAGIAPGAGVLADAPSDRSLRLAWEEVGLAWSVRRHREVFGVLHGPHYSLPLSPGAPCVVTVHDLTFVDNPEWHERPKVLYFRRALRLAARRAAVVVCVSERTARRFCEIYRPDVPVRVVPHGVDHVRFTPTEPGPGVDATVLRGLGVRPPYVLHTGTLQPRKDLVSLVAAFDRLARTQRDLTLVLAGGKGWGTGALDEAIAVSPHRSRVVRLGHVTDEVVPTLVRGASVVAYASLDEGFGLPVLEALACGTPVVTTEDSAMSEIAGTTVITVRRSAPDQLAEALESLLSGGPGVARRRLAGLELASGFTWEACAAGHVAAYHEAAGR